MNKLLSFLFLLLVVGCYHENNENIELNLKSRLTPLEFKVVEYLSGDYDGDGLDDVAAIVKCDDCELKIKSAKSKILWHSDYTSTVADQALIIVLNVGSIEGETYVLLSEYDRFTTPSFKLIKSTYKELKSLLESNVPDGDVLILPSEAGIDEFVLFRNMNITLVSPEDIP